MSRSWRDKARRYLSRTAPIVPPIYQTTTFELDDESYEDIMSTGGLFQDWYSRFRNPTVSWAADAIATLENAPAGLMTSSGMGAIGTTLLTLCRAGDRIVAARELYGDTRDLFVRDLPALGIDVDFVSAASLEDWERALSGGGVAVAYAETLSNPQLRVLDIPRVARLAHEHGAKLVVDNTFASAYTVQPLSHGADVVVHSATKFLSGHSDVIAGVVVSEPETIAAIQLRMITFGTCLDPHAAFLVGRGLRTYELRLTRQCESAHRLAEVLSGLSDDVEEVIYPATGSHPDRAIADRVWRDERRSAMVSLTVMGGNERAASFMRSLEVIPEATSLGGVETLISAPHNSSQFSYSADELAAAGIRPGMLRLSVGIEPYEELAADLARALERSRGRIAGRSIRAARDDISPPQ